MSEEARAEQISAAAVDHRHLLGSGRRCDGRRQRRRRQQTPTASRRRPDRAATFRPGLSSLGVEGDFDYFRSNPQFNNNTNTLANGNTLCHLAIADHQLPGDGASADRHRCGPQPRLHHRRRGIHQHQLHRKLFRRERSSGRRHRRPLRDHSSAGPPAPVGNMPLPTTGRSRPNICSRASRRRTRLA